MSDDVIEYHETEDQEQVLIKAEMPNVNRLMERISTGTTQSDNPKWEHLTCYDLDTYPMDRQYHMGKLGNSNFLPDTKINLSFLRAVSLDEGIEVKLYLSEDVDWHYISDVTGRAIRDFIRRHQLPESKFTVKKQGSLYRGGRYSGDRQAPKNRWAQVAL